MESTGQDVAEEGAIQGELGVGGGSPLNLVERHICKQVHLMLTKNSSHRVQRRI